MLSLYKQLLAPFPIKALFRCAGVFLLLACTAQSTKADDGYADSFDRADSAALGATSTGNYPWVKTQWDTISNMANADLVVSNNQLNIRTSAGVDTANAYADSNLDGAATYTVSFDFNMASMGSKVRSGFFILPRAQGTDLVGNSGWVFRVQAGGGWDVRCYNGTARTGSPACIPLSLLTPLVASGLTQDAVHHIEIGVTGNVATLKIDGTAVDINRAIGSNADNGIPDHVMLGHNALAGDARGLNAFIDNLTVSSGANTAPIITAQPQNATVAAGQTATFTVTAAWDPASTYQWQKNGTDIAGATSASYTTPATLFADNGALFRCVVSNSAGSVTSGAAILSVPGDTDGNGLPDAWEIQYFGATGQNPDAPAPRSDGLTILQAYQQGLNPLDFYNGQLPIIEIAGGNNQTGSPGAFVSSPLIVRVTDNLNHLLPNAPVTFTVTQGGTLQATASGTIAAALTVKTNAYGRAIVYFQLPNTPNAQFQIAARPATGRYSNSVLFVENSDAGSGSHGTPTLPPDNPQGGGGNPPANNPPQIPVQYYAALDISGTSANGNDVTMVALDDDNHAACLWTTGSASDGSLQYHIQTWQNGAVSGGVQIMDKRQVDSEYDLHVDYMAGVLTATGELLGDMKPVESEWSAALAAASGDEAVALINKEHANHNAFEFQGGSTTNHLVELNGWPPWPDNGVIGGSNNGFFTGPHAAVIWSNGSVVGTVPGFEVNGMNDNGVVVGYNVWEQQPAAMWSGTTVTPLPNGSYARAINNDNKVIGYNTAGEGCLWKDGFTAAPAKIKDLLPADYKSMLDSIKPKLISNADSGNAVNILFNATEIASGAAHDYVLQALTSGTNTLAQISLPDGVNADFHSLNASGIISSIGTPTTGTNASASTSAKKAILLLPVEVMVDGNRDGKMSFTEAAIHDKDGTTAEKPYRFWLNNDDDHGDAPGSDGTEHVPIVRADYTSTVIGSQRDLEDWARLWISFKGITQLVKATDITLELQFEAVPGSPAPTIRVAKAVEADGGRKYIDGDGNGSTATAASQASAPTNAIYGPISGSVSVDLKSSPHADWISNLTEENPYLHLLFEGKVEGKGKLQLKIKKGGTLIGTYPDLFLDIRDIKKLYQRAKGTPDAGFDAPYNYTNNPPSPNVGLVADENGNPFEQPPDEEKKAVVFVHGWNMSYDEAQNFSDTMFKRLWWQGYKGRFCSFRWPTLTSATSYNTSEHRAFKYAPALKQYVESLPAGYTRNVAAHSMGNIVTGEALQLGMQVSNYVLMQAAIPAGCYDDSQTINSYAPFLAAEQSKARTPDFANPDKGYRGLLNNVSGTLTSFYNTQDFALATGTTFGAATNWEANQQDYKPDEFWGGGYKYILSAPSTPNDQRPQVWFTISPPRIVTDSHEIMAFIARPRSQAVGADGRTRGLIGASVDLGRNSVHKFTGDREDHSGQFNRRIQQLQPFYRKLGEGLGVLPAQ